MIHPYLSKLFELHLSAGDQICLSKSANKHNRIFGKAEPMSDELCTDHAIFEPVLGCLWGDR